MKRGAMLYNSKVTIFLSVIFGLDSCSVSSMKTRRGRGKGKEGGL